MRMLFANASGGRTTLPKAAFGIGCSDASNVEEESGFKFVCSNKDALNLDIGGLSGG